jgi:hypothetical protein
MVLNLQNHYGLGKENFERDYIQLIHIYDRTQTGDKGDKWLNGQVTIRTSSYYRLRIEGVIGNRKENDFS